MAMTPEARWLQCIEDWFPQRRSQTYFLPPFFFRRTHHEVVAVPGVPLPVLQPVPRVSGATPAPSLYPPTHLTQPSLPVAGSVFTLPQGAPAPLPRHQDSDFVDDEAAEQVLGSLRALSDDPPEAMVVISQLEFRQYLDGCLDPILCASEAAYCASLPRPCNLPTPSHDGDFDVLIVHRHYGLLVMEVKAVGAHRVSAADLQRAVKKKVRQAIGQLDKAEGVLRHLLSDLHQAAKDKIEKDIKQLNKAEGVLHHLLSDLHQAAKDKVGKVNNQLNKEEAELRHLPSDIDQAAKVKVHRCLEQRYKVEGVPEHLLSYLKEVSEGKVLETIEQLSKAEGELLHLLTDRHQAVTDEVWKDIEHLNETESAPGYLLSHLKEVYKGKVGKAIEQLNKAEGELRHLLFELQAVKDKVGKSLQQLNKDHGELPHLLSPGVRITKTVVLPNVTSGELLQAIGGDTQLEKDLCACLGTRLGDLTAAIERCLCKEMFQSVSQNKSSQPSSGVNQTSQPSSGVNQTSQPSSGVNQPSQPSIGVNQTSQSSRGGKKLSPPLRIWWQQMTTQSAGPDPAMSDAAYDLLLSRFCGPATSVEVASVAASHRAVKTGKGKGKGKKGKACPATKVLRTEGEGVAETGLILSTLALYPDQVALLSDPALHFLHLCGPPGTGKTVMVVVKAIQELHQGHNVLVIITPGNSRTVSTLIEAQLLHAIGPNPPPGMGSVYLRDEEDFAQPEDMMALASAAGNLFVIADEVHLGSNSTLWMFIVLATSSLPGVSVWCTGPGSQCSLPGGMVERTLTVPLRTPPAVTSMAQTSMTGFSVGIPAYTALPVRAATDGAPVRWLEEHSEGLRGHSEGDIGDCEECAHNIVLLLTELGVGSSTGADALRYRDILILGDHYDNVTSWEGTRHALSARGVPWQILDVDDETSRREVALALTDAVTLADQDDVIGLERRVVIVLVNTGRVGDDGGGAALGHYWLAVSRCTGQLAVIRRTHRDIPMTSH